MPATDSASVARPLEGHRVAAGKPQAGQDGVEKSKGHPKGPLSWKGIPPQTLQRFAVSQGVAGMRVPYFDREGTLYRVKLFPDDGGSRWLGESRPQIPYGVWRLAKSEKRIVILTEGESDTLALATYLPRICSLGIPGAQSWKPAWARVLGDFDRVFCSFDADDAGRMLTDKVLADLPNARNVLLPTGADTRAFLQAMGTKAYVSLMHAAEATRGISQAFDAAKGPLGVAREIEAGWERAHG